MMSWLDGAALVLGAAAVFASMLALLNLAPRPGAARAVFMRGPAAGRENYTRRGWLLRNTALALAGAAVLAMILAGVFG